VLLFLFFFLRVLVVMILAYLAVSFLVLAIRFLIDKDRVLHEIELAKLKRDGRVINETYVDLDGSIVYHRTVGAKREYNKKKKELRNKRNSAINRSLWGRRP
jgi:hypothetical protein